LSRFLALDWDQNQLHVIAATVHGGTVTVQRAAVWQEERSPNPTDAEQLGQILRERLRSAGIAPAPVLACVGRDRLIVKDIKFPPVPEPEEAAIVRFQAVKELTDAPEDVVIDYAVVGEGNNGERQALALVIRREILETYQKVCQAAGLKLAALSPRPLGIAASLGQVMGTTVVTPPPDPADGAVAVVVVGERWAEFCVLRNGVPLLSRALTGGPNLAGEVRRNLAVHAGQAPQYPVCAVYVAGRGAGELVQRLSDLIETPIHTFDPFAGSEALDLPVGNRGSFAGAAGLLAVRARPDRLCVNFAAPRQAKAQRSPNYRLVRLGAAVALVVLVGLVVFRQALVASAESELDSLTTETRQVEDNLNRTKVNAKRVKAIDDWDNAVWLDEIYQLNCLIPDVNTLRVSSMQVEALPRTAKSKYVAVVTLKGKLFNSVAPRKPLDELVTRLSNDGYYSPEAPKVDKDGFTLRVHVERRPPGEYAAVLKLQPPPAGDGDGGKGGKKGKGKGKGKGGKKGPPRGRTAEE
jgi:hypothetical protein